MDAAWNERCRAREEMNREFESMQASSEHYREVWDEYGRIRDYNNSRIDSLRYEADAEHQAMIDCFERANSEYEYGDKAVAPMYAAEGHDHKDRRDSLNAEISALCQEVKAARQAAEYQAPKTDNSAFHAAKAVFEQAKASHESAQAEFKRLKAIRDSCKEAFNTAQAEHARAKEAFQRRLAEVKASKRQREADAISRVNMELVRTKPFYLGTLFGQDAKVVPRSDGSGKTDVYFAGMAKAGDGLGHGHAVIDSDGNVSYLRDAWQDHKDYLINDHAKGDKPTHKI